MKCLAMPMLIESSCEIVVIYPYCPGHSSPRRLPGEASCSSEYLVISTTARQGLLYCRFALPSSPALELWCLCYLILGFQLATAVDIGDKQNKGYNNIQTGAQHHRLTYKTSSGDTVQQLITTQQSSGNLQRRSNEVGNKLIGNRQNNIAIASLQSHIKHFSKIRTTEGGLKPSDQRQVRDISEDHVLEEQTVTSSNSSSTTKPWNQPEEVAIPAVTTPSSPMSPVHPTAMDTMGSNVVVIVLVLALVLATLGVLTCILSTYRYRTGGGGGAGMGGRARSELPSDTPGLLGSNANLPMLALPGGMCEEREVAALRDRHVRNKSVRTDMELDLPPNIRLPDGEELPYGCSTRLQIRAPEQESEIYQKCVRPPPNRTVFDGESPPPYRSSSAGLLSHNTPASIDWAQDTPPEKVIRCHSMSSGSSRSGSTPSTTPAVVVPSRSRRLSAFSDTGATGGALSQLTMVSCHRGAEPPV